MDIQKEKFTKILKKERERKKLDSHVNRQNDPEDKEGIIDPSSQSAKAELQAVIKDLVKVKQRMFADDWGQGFNVGVGTCIRILKTRLERLK